jgi:alpha-L-glutamate ligase-like protein
MLANLLHRPWHEVLGMNARTIEYISRANQATSVRLANKKLATKRILQKAGLPTPRLFSVIRTRQELKRFRWTKLPSSFVLKPNSSSGGAGIIVIFGRNKKGNWVKADKSEVFIPALRDHILDILDGNFSKGNVPDIAFFEQRVKVHADLKPYSVKGVPDIRILVYNLVPIMAMLRLPTATSGGRANLHAGGVGVGIDLVSGRTTTAIYRGKIIDTLPGSRLSLTGIQIPFWDEVLSMAVRTAQHTNLHYAGVDIAIDREDGPMVLEINARPGLDIQFANLAPLKSRLKRVEGLKVTKPEKGIQIAKNLFGGSTALDQSDTLSQPILGIEEKITIWDSEGQTHHIIAKIDTGAYRTTIDETLAKTYGLHTPILDYKGVRGALGRQTRPIVEIKMMLKSRLIKTRVFLADRSYMKYDMIVGRRDLPGFLVDPSRRVHS